MKKLYHHWARIHFLTVFLLFCSPIVAQKIFSGVINGTDGVPLAAATVVVQGTNQAVLSAADGRFSILAKSGDVLLVSSVGMIRKSVQVKSETFIPITLAFVISSMEEILIIGYGTSRRKDVTGAVSKLKEKDFNTGAITNPMQQLLGKVAGLVILHPGGDPNGEFTVRIRGATSLEGQPPLLVIDGVAIDDFNKAISTLNPSDVESFDVLKDASAAAIYGARGANGVILVTTKKGRVGKTEVDYDGFVSMQKTAHLISTLNGDEWRKATAGMNAGSLDGGANTDWQKAIARTGFSHSHTIGISGGTDQLNFRGSIGYIRQQGIIINSGNEEVTARLTAVQKSINNKLEVRYGVNVSTIKRDFLPDQTSTDQSRTFGSGIFGVAISYLPVWPAYNPDGTYYQPANNSINPLFLLKEIYSKQRENFFQGSVKADYDLFKGLKLGILGALSRGNDVADLFQPKLPGTNELARASKSNYNKQIFSGDIHSTYRKNIDKHTIDFTAVYEYNKFLKDGFGVTARGFLVPELLNNNLRTATDVLTNDIFSYKSEVKLISFLGRVVYNYNDRYILTANFRRDGSSKFGTNNRWGNFPSIAFAWRSSNENFMKNIKWLDDLKVRMSYGLTGNQENLPPDNYQLLYGPSEPYLYNGQFYQSYAVTQENNPDLKWEVRKSFNIGVDFSVLHDRINGTIDVFNDHTNDMLFLYDIPQPPFLTNKVYANAASAVNKGIEVTLNAAIFKTRDFSWDIQPNIATLNNHITELLGDFKGITLSLKDPSYGYAGGGAFGFTAVTRLSIGHPAGVFWIPQHAGLDAAGHELYNNYDTAGKLTGTSTSFTDQDRVFIDPTPRFTWGLTNKFRIKNFDLEFLLRGVQGQKIFANTLLQLENIQYLPGSNVTSKALTNGFTERPQASTYWLRDGSYTRLENVTLAYNVKNSNGFNSIRLYLTATNLFIITSYEGVDPEVRTEGNERYIDFLYYPKPRGFTVGANVKF